MATYTATAVSRTPAQSTGPNLVELGPIHGSISYTESLNLAGGITLSVDVDTLPEDIKSRLRNPLGQPLEVWIYRNSKVVAAGSFIGGSIDGTTLTLDVTSLEAYTAYMLIYANKSWVDTDLSVIVSDVIDNWQILDYGDFGIETTTVGTSGVTRTASFPGAEEPITVYDFLKEQSFSGFDWWIDPETRGLRVEAAKGSDLSNSVFLERGVTSSSVRFAVSPGLVASEVYATGTGPQIETPLTTIQANTTTRSTFGRSAVAISVDPIEDAAHLTEVTQSFLADRATTLFIPGPGLVPVTGADVDDFGVGDIVTYTFDAGLGLVTGAYRIIKRTVSVSDDAQETMTVEFDEV